MMELPSTPTPFHPKLDEKVFSKMNNNMLCRVAKSDPLIVTEVWP